MFGSQIPLAWKNLTHDVRKLLVALAGISFAVMLMFQQRGFNNALFDSTVEVVKHLDGDLILFNEARFALSNELRFSRDAIDVARGIPQVALAEPIFMENSAALLRKADHRARPIRVIAYDLRHPLFQDTNRSVRNHFERLADNSTAIIDLRSKRDYGFDLNPDAANLDQSGELAGQSIEIVGQFTLGRDFAHEGNLIMSDRNFARYFRYRGIDPLSVVDLGLIQCESPEAAEAVKAALQDRLPKGVDVMTRDEFIEREIGFWARSTPIGMVFAIGAIMGFVVGVIICYQILANDIADHLGEFATLKAMGYGNWYFFQLVITEALYLSIMGFVPGLLFSLILFKINAAFTGLIMVMTVPRALLILGLTIVMCVISGLLALRKLLSADPASLF